jgi:hypothetical protein
MLRESLRLSFFLALCVCLLLTDLVAAADRGVASIKATADFLEISAKTAGEPLEILELQPFQKADAIAQARVIARLEAGESVLKLPRFDGERDRIYSGFAARDPAGNRTPTGPIRFVDELQNVSKDTSPLPVAASKKGLQVQMVDDAIALGVKHAALNVDLASLIDLSRAADSLAWKMDGETYHFRRRAVENIPVKKLSDAGMQVTLILLNYVTKDAALDKIVRPARSPAEPPNRINAFNVDEPDGLRYYKACIEFLADRFSGANPQFGRVTGYIVGNEVNSHWHWYNLGEVSMDDLADNYLRALRITHTAVRKASAHARVYISLDHFWNGAMSKEARKVLPGRALVDHLNQQSKLGGDFDWHIAHHPYPENLFEPRTWKDKTTASFDSKRITFKNLEQLPLYLRQKEQLCNGTPRRVILSEQGFHTPDGPDGEAVQAAGYCYAYHKVEQLDGIDAFILHRHVDHKGEGGLKLGLWTWKESGLSTPDRAKKIYEVFKLADTPEQEKAFEFALPIIGLKSWSELKGR